MIGPAGGTVDLHVTSTQREAAVGREGRCKQWLNAVSPPLPCIKAIGLGSESQSIFLSLDISVTLLSLIVTDRA